MDILKQLLGRLHPLIVHLPIGFILLGLLLQWYDRKKNAFTQVIALIFLWGGYSAVAACVTGYAQYIGEGYAFDTVKIHLWSGIVAAIFSFLMYAKLKELKAVGFLSKISIVALSMMFFLLISFTGHQGGNITHGKDYLIEPLPNNIKSALGFETFEEKTIILTNENWEETLLYEEVIKPILNNRCVSCHNPKKVKGELLLHSEQGILKGGENGDIIIAKNAVTSELFTRMKLPITHDDHMPPDGKKQPTKEEVQLIGAWINAGHPFDQTIKTAGLEKGLFLSFFPQKIDNDYPNIIVNEASKDSISRIETNGIHVDQISKISNFLKVSCINKPSFTDIDFELLKSISQQIAILDLGGTQVTNAIFKKLIALPHLTILKLDHTAITGEKIELLKTLNHLKSINLTSTDFEAPYLRKLADFQKLRRVYVYKTKLKTTSMKTMKDGKITIDYGNYELPQIASDSIIY